jgi:hypothetical protein
MGLPWVLRVGWLLFVAAAAFELTPSAQAIVRAHFQPTTQSHVHVRGGPNRPLTMWADGQTYRCDSGGDCVAANRYSQPVKIVRSDSILPRFYIVYWSERGTVLSTRLLWVLRSIWLLLVVTAAVFEAVALYEMPPQGQTVIGYELRALLHPQPAIQLRVPTLFATKMVPVFR